MLTTMFPPVRGREDWEQFLGVPPGSLKGVYGKKKCLEAGRPVDIDIEVVEPDAEGAGAEKVTKPAMVASAGSFTIKK